MFIKKLYQYNKVLCLSFIAFIGLFVFINYKWGVVATPILQYGMYSQVFHTTDTQTVYLIEANDVKMNSSEFSLTERDILQVYPFMYENEKKRNEAVYVTMKKYIRFTGMLRYMKFDRFMNQVTDSLFTDWYKTKIEKITGTPIHSLHVYRQHFIWNLKRLEPVDSLTKLKYIGT